MGSTAVPGAHLTYKVLIIRTFIFSFATSTNFLQFSVRISDIIQFRKFPENSAAEIPS